MIAEERRQAGVSLNIPPGIQVSKVKMDKAQLEKKRQMEERRNRWMADRDASVGKEAPAVTNRANERNFTAHPPLNSTTSTGRNEKPRHSMVEPSASHQTSDEFIDKLTQKLSHSIREEVKRELSMTTHSPEVRDVISEQMQSYLAAELGTHSCKICSRLMTSPNHTPILLFPCGHTFCKSWYNNSSMLI